MGEEGNEDNNENSESRRLANTPGSVHSLADPKFRTFTPNMNTSSMAYNNVEEEADKWLEKSSWDSSMPGLRKNYPSSLAKYSTPGGANPNEWRDKIKYSRDGWAHRVERYRLNKQSFHDLLRKRAGLTPVHPNRMQQEKGEKTCPKRYQIKSEHPRSGEVEPQPQDC